MIFKSAALCVSAVCLIPTAIAQPPLPKTPAGAQTLHLAVKQEPPESPYKALDEFVRSINGANWMAASNRVLGGRNETELKPIIAELQATYGNWSLKVEQHHMFVTNAAFEDFADVKIRLILRDNLGNKISHDERLSLQLDNKLWKIVPLAPDKARQAFWGNLDSEFLENIATCFSYPQFINASKATDCMNNLKQLGLAAMQFVQDYDEKYVLQANTFADYLRPYFRNDDILICPMRPREKNGYTFNVKLEKATLAQIQQPAQTVLIYEGANEKLDFRHDNRAGVAFADGHVQLVTPEEAKNLNWVP